MSLPQVTSAFAQWDSVASRLVFEGADRRDPLLSICIPTFRRGDLLVEAVQSALNQDWGGALEIVVVDNDPESGGVEALVARLPRLRDANFRYYVNGENIGMFGNWNRAIQLGRGEWHTTLHDDDLLEPGFASTLMGRLLADPAMDGLTCRRHVFGPAVIVPQGRARGVARRLGSEVRFRGAATRRFRPKRFFWSATNPVGLIARKRDLIALGGYQPDEWPSSDHYFQLRFALAYRLYEAREYLVRVRVLENESLRRDTLVQMIAGFHFLRLQMAGSVVPAWLAKLSPMLVEEQRLKANVVDHAHLTKAEMEEACRTVLPTYRRKFLIAMRAATGGY
jgi:glycosyltransferase involved in cell wall biosynthesis